MPTTTMLQVTSLKRASLKKTYENTLMNLLNTDDRATLSSDSDGRCHSDSKRFEKDLKRLLVEGDFALDLLERFLLEDTANTSGHHRSVSPNTGFQKLTRECYKFLSRTYISCFPLHDGNSKRDDRDVGGVSDEEFSNQKPKRIKNSKPISANDRVEFNPHLASSRVDGDPARRADDDRGPMDLHQASKCLAGLITLTETQSFETLLSSVCFRRDRTTNRSLGLLILEAILATNGIQAESDLRNLRLAFGETPLLLAVRARDAEVVLALLRHGADVSRGWMGLENALEVLLFSPNQVFLEPHDISTVERCLEYLLRVMSTVDLEALAVKEKNGYYPLIPGWRQALSHAMGLSWATDSIPVPSLQHLCRCVIRQSMGYLGHRLPEGLHSLPLPVIVRQFLHI